MAREIEDSLLYSYEIYTSRWLDNRHARGRAAESNIRSIER